MGWTGYPTAPRDPQAEIARLCTFETETRSAVPIKISKRGSPTLRHALYLAAFVVCRKHAYFQRIYRKHRARGKSHRNALVVVASHLARVIWRLLTDNREFTKRPPTKPAQHTERRRKRK